MISSLKFFAVIVLVALLGAPHSVLAQQDATARVLALQELMQDDNSAALRMAKELGKSFDASTPYPDQREFLNTLITLQWEAGDIDATVQSIANLRQLAQTQKDTVGILLATVREANFMDSEGKSAAAFAKLSAIESAALATHDPDLLWRFYVSLGSMNLGSGKFEEALTSVLKSIDYAQQRRNMRELSHINSLQTLSSIYGAMSNHDKALAILDDALKLADQSHSKKTMGSLMLSRGAMLTSLQRRSEALHAYRQALQIGAQAKLLSLQATALNNISDFHLTEKQYALAETIARQAFAKYQEAGDQFGAATARVNIGFALMGQGKARQGLSEVRTALAVFENANARPEVEGILGELGQMLQQLGMYKEAVETIREQQALSKELFRKDREESVAALQEQFDTVNRQKKIELLARENSLKDADLRNQRLQQTVTTLGAVVTLMAGIFIYLLYRKVVKSNKKLSEVNAELAFHSVHDPLTGLQNRRSFLDLMKTRVTIENVKPNDQRRQDGSTDGLMVLDIDFFKHINDTLGHAGGDAVLVEIAKRLKGAVRDSDRVIRWGGEEFLIFSPKISSTHQTILAQRILNCIACEPIEVGNKSINVSVSGGFLSLPFSGLSEQVCNWEKALQIADLALYLAKAHGRNRNYGVLKLLLPMEQVMPTLETDIATAFESNMVEWVEVRGPVVNDN